VLRVTGCGDLAEVTEEGRRQDGEDGQHHLTLDLVDRSRPTPAGAGLDHADERRLVTHVYLPAGRGPFPFIAFAHGLNGHPRKFTELLGTWAEAGYAVAAPAFPLSNDEVPGEATFADLAEQPGDISFVIDQMLALSEDSQSPVFGTVDPERIGVAGLSLGGATTYGVAFNDCCLDERPIAAMVLDGARLAVGGEFDLTRGLPLLIVHADEDYALAYSEAADAYADAVAPKWLVTLHEFAHAEPFEDTVDPADDLVHAVTVAFWDRYLDGDEGAEERLVAAVAPATLATLASEP
jgi:dienelactone hydrolase